MASRKNRLKPTQGNWGEQKRIEVATVYLETGNLAQTARLCDIPYVTIRDWRYQDWWNELIVDINQAKNSETKNKFKKIVDSSLTVVADRLENGDFQYDPKTGEMVRVPVKMRDTGKILRDAQEAVQNINEEQRKIERKKKEEDITDRLLKLAESFQKMSITKEEPIVIENQITDIS